MMQNVGLREYMEIISNFRPPALVGFAEMMRKIALDVEFIWHAMTSADHTGTPYSGPCAGRLLLPCVSPRLRIDCYLHRDCRVRTEAAGIGGDLGSIDQNESALEEGGHNGGGTSRWKCDNTGNVGGKWSQETHKVDAYGPGKRVCMQQEDVNGHVRGE